MDGLTSCMTVECQKKLYGFGEGQILMLLNKGYGVAPFFFIVVIVSGVLFDDDMLCLFEGLPFMMMRYGVSEGFGKSSHVRVPADIEFLFGEFVIVHGCSSFEPWVRSF